MEHVFVTLIILLPLVNFFIILVLGSLLGHKGSCFVSTTNLIIAFALSLYFFLTRIGAQDILMVRLWPWLTIGELSIYWDFYLDIVCLSMFLVVTLISSLVHLYSISYMSEDPFQSSFMSYLSLFTFFMLILVSSGNFFQLFLGWEGVGLCSFLLISFWSDRVYAVGSAVKAIVLNRIGDVGLILAMVFIYLEMGTFDFPTIFALSSTALVSLNYVFLGYEVDFFSLISIFLLLAAIGKSSQYLLHGWLPDAMEGPTPVSALIHAATMVTAGVFLLIRCSSIFANAPRVLALIAIVGFLTSLFGAFTGSRVYDLKKMIAYSTTSHLGYMFMACGMLANSVALFHLVVHACFKALLFLSAGSIIHAFSNEQDVRKMSGLDIFLPITVMSIVIGSSTMNGIFGLSGAISKDSILFVNLFGYSYMRYFGYGFLLLSVFLGALYAARISSFFFEDFFSGAKAKVKLMHESDFFILIPLLILSCLSVYVGFFLESFFKDEYSSLWFGGRFFFHTNYSLSFGEFGGFSMFFKTYGDLLSDEDICLLIENVAAFATFFSIYIYKIKQFYVLPLSINLINKKMHVVPVKDNLSFFYTYTEKRSMTDRIYNKIFTFMEFRNAKVYFFDYFEKGALELLGPTGITRLTLSLSNFFSKWNTGFVHQYLFFSITFILGLLLTLKGFFFSIFFFVSFLFLFLKK